MKCVRCLNDTAAKFAEAPDKSGAWEVYICGTCNFSWRNTEEEEVINPKLRDPNFQLTNDDIAKLQILVPVPPLRK